ncbi:MAG: HAD family hydrolase [Desulfobacterota bacterium]|nr:HAD family hydrolase [Thermodesulfobacteriota bacterium]MDW8002017.1 HAD family hydrolase [Deltaproteobacteria bacterium]
MISVSIPGWGDIEIEYLLVDYNGTIALDGKLKAGVKELLEKISRYIRVFIVTADTYDSVDSDVDVMGFNVLKVKKDNSAEEKAKIVKELGPEKVLAIGNGANDALMLKEAALGIGVIGEEGCAKILLKEADIIVKDITEALNIVLHPERIIATLQS